MPSRTLPFLAVAMLVGVIGCRRAPVATQGESPVAGAVAKTMPPESSHLASAVEAYARTQNPENDAAVRKAMAAVDTEMAELVDLVAKRHGRDREKVAEKLRHLEDYRSEETTRFAAIQAGTALAAPDPREAPAITGNIANPARNVEGDETPKADEAAEQAVQ